MTQIGTAITLIGLAIQFVFFIAFIWVLHRICTDETFGLKDLPSLSKVFVGLRASILLLLIRNIYRIIEFATGPGGPVYAAEWSFYVFETVPILLACVVYCVFHFDRLLETKSAEPLWITEFDVSKSSAASPI